MRAGTLHVDGKAGQSIGLLKHGIAVKNILLAEDHPDRLASERAIEYCNSVLRSSNT